MAVHGQTMTWGSHAGHRTPHGGWLQRLRQWFFGHASANGRVPPMAFYGSWDGQREKFRPLSNDSALDQVASQGGRSWSIPIHSAML